MSTDHASSPAQPARRPRARKVLSPADAAHSFRTDVGTYRPRPAALPGRKIEDRAVALPAWAEGVLQP
jgi:hypothetical protein